MARYGGNNYGPSIGDMTVGDYANAMPNIRLGEMFRSFGRQLRWLIPLFVFGALPAWYLTKDIKRTYEGVGSVMVKQGPEHTFRPVGGEQGGAILQGPEAITELEIAVMTSNTVIEAVEAQMKNEFSKEMLYKSAYEKIKAAEDSGDIVAINNAKVELLKTIEAAFWATPRAKAGVIDVGFKHEDPAIAVRMLEALLLEYQESRKNLFVDGSADFHGKEVVAIEEQLTAVEGEIRNLLKRNGISNFDSEREGASERTEALRAELNTIRAQISATEASLNTVEGQLRGTDDNVVTRKTHLDKQRISQAELELKQLLAKYLPNSDPVRAKQAEIDELRALQTSTTEHIGGIETGPNPVYQALLTRLNELKATADSLREREFTVQQLLGENDAKVRKLTLLAPEYNNLLREQQTLDLRLRGVNSKYQEALVNQAQAAATNSENIKIIWPSMARKGRNMSKILFALIMIGWGFTLFMLALLRVFLDPRLYTDPTRRMRPKPEVQDYASDDWGRDVPYRDPAQPYIPEPVRPAAAHYQDPYAPQPYAPQPYQPQPYQPQPSQAPMATMAGYSQPEFYGNTAAAPLQAAYPDNPYAPPQIQTESPAIGPLPSSETG